MTHKHTAILALVASVFSLVPSAVFSQAAGKEGAAAAFAKGEPFTQEFTLTAYYSPLPNQCCYVKGSFEDDVILNGKGTNGADGTPVYPGMLAAPPAYAFGTRVSLPGLGIMTVHDRGGAIQEWTDSHRLDVWAGVGEEGLARALAFGVKHIKGTVYPVGTAMPEESFALASLPSPLSYLTPFMSPDASLLSLHPEAGQKGLSVELLQKKLHDAGYFTQEISGLYGPVTEQAVATFYDDMGIEGSTKSLTDEAAAMLEAAAARANGKEPVSESTGGESSPARIAAIQRTLRLLGFYKGRTSGRYNETLAKAIIAFQLSQNLIGDAQSPGAGRVGPKTRAAMMTQWKRTVVAESAQKILAYYRIDKMLASGDLGIKTFLGRGQSGKDVRALQTYLAQVGFFDRNMINGIFGAQTQKAVIAYQTEKGIIKGTNDKGAGYVGPATLTQMRRQQRIELYKLVRAQGWEAL